MGSAVLVVVLFVGFAGGYGVREYISRRRHVAARRIFLEKHPEFGPAVMACGWKTRQPLAAR
jgi:hypothetical protein